MHDLGQREKAASKWGGVGDRASMRLALHFEGEDSRQDGQTSGSHRHAPAWARHRKASSISFNRQLKRKSQWDSTEPGGGGIRQLKKKTHLEQLEARPGWCLLGFQMGFSLFCVGDF